MKMRKNLIAMAIIATVGLLLQAVPRAFVQAADAPVPPSQKQKNWHAPPGKILAQELVDRIMAKHPALLSLTLHGVPPGTSLHTMFAGSFPDRIGNPDDPDDLEAQENGLTILDPALHHPGKFVVFIPLWDAARAQVGTAVVVFKADANHPGTPLDYYRRALAVRRALQERTPSLAALFQPAR